MAEFFSMGGYAVFVWGSYGLTAGGVALILWIALRQRAKAKAWQAMAGEDTP